MEKADSPALPEIIEEKLDWGVRLIVKPFPDARYATLEISVEVTSPLPGRNPDIRTRFSAVPVSFPLRQTDVIVWMAQMNAIQDRAKQIAAKMKEKPAKKAVKKKAAKKKA